MMFHPTISRAAMITVGIFNWMDPRRTMVCHSFSPALPLLQPPPSSSPSFSATKENTKESSTTLWMGKGFNKFKNKGQADLKRKLELAKQQQKSSDASEEGNDSDTDSESPQVALTVEQIKERNDRQRFEELLQREGAKSLNNYNSNDYLSKNQEEEEITAARSGVDRIFEGDPAPTDCFENLVSVTTENKVAKKGAGRLAPWISNDYGIDANDYRIVICDPRKQSAELHQAIQDLSGSLPKDIKDRLYFINSDTPAENRRWMKKNGLQDKVDMYCDTEDMDWMKSYTALGENRWSMTMFLLRKGKVAKLARDLDVYNASRTVINAVKAMKSDL